MKKIFALLCCIFILSSCSSEINFIENDDKSICLSSGEVFYPIKNTHRFSHLGGERRVGKIGSEDVFFLNKSADVIIVGDDYYVSQEHSSFDIAFEECSQFLFVPRKRLKNGRASQSVIDNADKLTGVDAEDFSFYVFYGREPREFGFENGVHFGQILGLFETDLPLVSSYPVYKWSQSLYSVEIDGVQYTLEDKWAKKIGIID